MQDRQTCVGCGKQSPETETNYTLISAQFGWRLSRSKAADGSLLIEWRCPTCWRDFKRARSATDGPPTPRQAPIPPPAPPAATGSSKAASSPASARSSVKAQSSSQPARPRRPAR